MSPSSYYRQPVIPLTYSLSVQSPKKHSKVDGEEGDAAAVSLPLIVSVKQTRGRGQQRKGI